MNEREQQICSRFKEVREKFQHTQIIFATAVGIRLDRLKSIEYGRTPLRSDVAIAAARLTGCSLLWLAEGRGPWKGPLPSPDLIEQIGSKSLLSSAWDNVLSKASQFVASHAQFGYGATHSASALSYAIEEITGAFGNLPADFHSHYFAHLHKATSDFFGMNQAAICESNAKKLAARKHVLTDSESRDLIGGMKAQLPELLGRLKRATSAPGKKTELADFLSKVTGEKVPLASVSRWLAGEREPGGEIALQMDAWATKQGFPK